MPRMASTQESFTGGTRVLRSRYQGEAVVAPGCEAGKYLNEKYPEGNSVNPKQTGALNLWGSIYDPDHRALYCLYGVGFLVAITGFLLHLSFVMRCFLEIEPSLYCKICVAMLCFMATEHCWMPLCCVYIAAPSDVLWWVICLQLKLSGLLTLVWTYFTWQIDPEILAEASYGGPVGDAGKRKLYRKIGLCGNVMFCLHCCVLDGTVWSFYFNADGGRFPPPTAGG
eukprot:g13840.t1